MKFIKFLLFLLALLLLGFGAMFLLGLTFTILKFAFWILVIGGILALLVKLFGSDSNELPGDPQTRIQNAELTIEEYKRKLEAQLKSGSENRQ